MKLVTRMDAAEDMQMGHLDKKSNVMKQNLTEKQGFQEIIKWSGNKADGEFESGRCEIFFSSASFWIGSRSRTKARVPRTRTSRLIF